MKSPHHPVPGQRHRPGRLPGPGGPGLPRAQAGAAVERWSRTTTTRPWRAPSSRRSSAAAVIFSAILAASLPLYWLLEPDRQEKMGKYFLDDSAERGRLRFAVAGTVPAERDPPARVRPLPRRQGRGRRRHLPAPADRARGTGPDGVRGRRRRSTTCSSGSARRRSTQIITYGRPGHPDAGLGSGRRRARCPSSRSRTSSTSCSRSTLTPEAAQKRNTERVAKIMADNPGISEGQALFMAACARCHTKGWSYGDPQVDGRRRRLRAQPDRRRDVAAVPAAGRRGGQARRVRDDRVRLPEDATAPRASDRAACRASGRCSQPARSTRSSSTSAVSREGKRRMLGILATEAGGHLDLVGELRGYAIVVFSVGLFCGSIYLLLATDVGNRLGFMISFASLTGFLAHAGAHLVHQPDPAQRPPRAAAPLEGEGGRRRSRPGQDREGPRPSRRKAQRSTPPPRARSRPPSTPP